MTAARTQRQAFGLTILNANHPEIRRLKREGYHAAIHGNKFWNSSYLLMNYFKTHPLKRGSRVLELGCGWGLLGIYCAKNFGCKVTGVDADENVFPYLKLHAEKNRVEMATERNSFERLSRARLAEFDVILGADICFWDDLAGTLYNLVRRSRQASVRSVMIADPCRSPFTVFTARCQDNFEGVEVLSRRISRPVKASGEILILKND